MNYIYIDTKIEGTIHQLIEYFHFGVFDSKDFLIYYKQYKKETKLFSKIFSKAGVNAIGFRKYSEVHLDNGSIVFYLFNAQSNCRIVANRKVKHVFVTHGESNKISSIKPIIRIYDHVITAGQIGVERYMDEGIFYPEDITRNRIIMMGDTFIGDNCYKYAPQSNAILYAPTWEGGIPEENYSSLEWNNVFDKIIAYCKFKNIQTVVIQPHPNLGYRDKRYKSHLYNGINRLLKQSLTVILMKNGKRWVDRKLSLLHSDKFQIRSKQEVTSVQEAFCDISAMEAQLYAKYIPTRVFIKEGMIIDNEHIKDHYKLNGINYSSQITYDAIFDSNYFYSIFQYSSKELENPKKKERLNSLCNFIK